MKKTRIITFALLMAISSAFFGKAAFAEEKMDYSINLSPAHHSVELDPGATYDGSFRALNTGLNTIEFYPTIDPYQVSSGVYSGNLNIRNQYTEMADWITFDTDYYSIEPGEGVEVNYHVNVPANAHGGSQFVALGIATKSGPQNAIIEATRKITILLRADISGDIIYGGNISSQSITGFLLEPPFSAKVSVKNTGNISSEATSILRVTNTITGQEIYNNSGEPASFEIYPETYREYDVQWADSPRLGIYNVTITTTFLSEVATESRTVFICPIWLVCAVIVLILVTIVVIIAKKRHQSHIQSRGFKFNN